MFLRPKGMLPLPVPIEGGDLDELRQLLNVSNRDWPLVVAWLVAVFRPVGPYPILAVHGEHGSAKTNLCRMLRALIDPHGAPLRGEPRQIHDLIVSAHNGWIIGLDNMSHLSTSLSDALCRFFTGGGFASRTLFQNDDETIFDAQRPIMINGIEEVGTRSDLLDRCMMLSLPSISADRRRTEAEVWADFDAACPSILGALLFAVAVALRNLPSTRIDSPPRMADFAQRATAAEPALGLAPGEFMRAYVSNRAASDELVLEVNPIGSALVDFAEEVGTWAGTATQLLAVLKGQVDERSRQKGWPNGARALSVVLRRLATNLRAVGVDVQLGTRAGHTGVRTIVLTQLERVGSFASASSAALAAVEPSDLDAVTADAAADPASAEIAVPYGKSGAADATYDADANFLLDFPLIAADDDGTLRQLFRNLERLPSPGERICIDSLRHPDPAQLPKWRRSGMQMSLTPLGSTVLQRLAGGLGDEPSMN